MRQEIRLMTLGADTTVLKTPKFDVIERQSGNDKTYLIAHPGAVVILPLIDPLKIGMIRNYRKAVDQPLVELPAGTLEPNESPMETAQRELAEETGYRAASIKPVFEYFVSPGILNEKMHAFVATDLTAGSTSLMPDEDIENITVDYQDALDWIRIGIIQDAKTIATLLFYHQFKSQSR